MVISISLVLHNFSEGLAICLHDISEERFQSRYQLITNAWEG